MLNKKELEILKVIKKDIGFLNIDRFKDDNQYYLNLIKGNILDLLRGKYARR